MLVVSGAVQNFTYDNFTVLSVAPAAGQVGGGTVVVLRLSLVSMETAYYCSFGNTSQPVPATFVNASSLQCTTPEYGIAEPGAGWEVVQLSVTDNLEQWTAAYVPYTYIGPYNLSEVQPMRGPKQGLTVVTLVGENLAAAQPLYCLFDNVSVTAVQVTPQLAECTSPASTLAPADPSEYAATFAVSYNLQEQLTHLLGGGPALNFTYDNLSVTAVGPEVGSAQGGTVVLVYTTGVFNTTTYLVSFGNDSSAVAATFLSNNVLSCVTPPFFLSPPSLDSQPVLLSISSNLQQWEGSEDDQTVLHLPGAFQRVAGVALARAVDGRDQRDGGGHEPRRRPAAVLPVRPRPGPGHAAQLDRRPLHSASVTGRVRVCGRLRAVVQPAGAGAGCAGGVGRGAELHLRQLHGACRSRPPPARLAAARSWCCA